MIQIKVKKKKKKSKLTNFLIFKYTRQNKMKSLPYGTIYTET